MAEVGVPGSTGRAQAAAVEGHDGDGVTGRPAVDALTDGGHRPAIS